MHVWTYLSFQVVLPLLRLQSFEASAAVGGDRHAEGPVSSGGELGGEGHGDGPRIDVIAPTHHQIWTGAWVTQEDMSETSRWISEAHWFPHSVFGLFVK